MIGFIVKFLALFTLIHVPLLSVVAAQDAVVTYELAGDWSDERNPNGVWTYTGNNGALLGVNLPEWDVRGFFLPEQPAWANAAIPNSNHVPMWFKAVAPSALDVPGVGMHGSEGSIDAWVGVIWRSPMDGTVSISGGVWQALKAEVGAFGGTHRNRNADWRLRHNQKILASGNISGIDQYSSRNPSTYATGAQGGPLTHVAVDAGDEIVLEFISPTSFAPFVGISLSISATRKQPQAD